MKTKTYASSYWYNAATEDESGDRDLAKLAATQRAIGNFVNIVTGKTIPVKFQSSGNSYTDGEHVVIGSKINESSFDHVVGLALHEGSHIALTDFSMFKTMSGQSTSYVLETKLANLASTLIGKTLTVADVQNIKQLLNWIEDRRIDYHIYTTAPGYRAYYEAMYNKYFNDKIIDKALKSGVKCNETWDDYMFHIINFTNPNRNLYDLACLKRIWDVIDLKTINRLQTTSDSLAVACRVFTLIDQAVTAADIGIPDTDNKTNNSISQSDSDAGKSLDKDNISEETDEYDSDDNTQHGSDNFNEFDDSEFFDNDDDSMSDTDDSESNPTLQAPQLTPSEQNKLNNAIEAQRAFINNNIKKTGSLNKFHAAMVNAYRESGTEIRKVYTDPTGTMDPVTTLVIKKINMNVICSLPSLFNDYSREYINDPDKFAKHVACGRYSVYDISEMEKVVNAGLQLGRQLGNRLHLRNTSRDLKSTRLGTGKIDKRLISELGYGNVNVFHRVVADKFKNYFIHISIDASGSMAGKKFHQAIKSAVAIAQAATMTSGIRVQITLRGTITTAKTEQCVTMYVYDSAVDKLSKIRSLFKYLKTYGCTPEGISFKSIQSDIKRDAKGDECIFINYSDGEPTTIKGANSSIHPAEYARKVIESYRDSGLNVMSYFITANGCATQSQHRTFLYIYGPDSKFIDPTHLTSISKTINDKFLEIKK